MQLPGLLIEYLIDGAFAILWLYPVLFGLGYTLQKDDAVVLLFPPAMYVLGMMIDFLSGFIVKGQKRRIQEKVQKDLKIPSESAQVIAINLLLYAPELAKASEMRSSRDRIARGTIVNFALATVVLTALSYYRYGAYSAIATFLVGVTLVIICWNMWAHFQTLSYRYDFRAFCALGEKPKSEQDHLTSKSKTKAEQN